MVALPPENLNLTLEAPYLLVPFPKLLDEGLARACGGRGSCVALCPLFQEPIVISEPLYLFLQSFILLSYRGDLVLEFRHSPLLRGIIHPLCGALILFLCRICELEGLNRVMFIRLLSILGIRPALALCGSLARAPAAMHCSLVVSALMCFFNCSLTLYGAFHALFGNLLCTRRCRLDH